MTSTEKQLPPPHDHNAERALLGSIIIDPDCYFYVSDIVKDCDFYLVQTKAIYQAISDLSINGQPIDVISIQDKLKARSKTPPDDIIAYLLELPLTVPTSINAREYARIVAEYATRRRMIYAGRSISSLGYDLKSDVKESLGKAEGIMFDVRGNDVKDVESPHDYAMDYLHRLDRMQHHDGSLLGLPSGFIDIDRILDGFQAPYQYLIAGRPGMGKSAFAGNIVDHNIRQGKRAAFFALEMSTRQMIDRIIARRTKIPLSMIKKPWLLNGETKRIQTAVAELSEQGLFIDDTPGLTPGDIRAKCMRLHAQHGLDMIVVDHIHLLNPDRHLARTDLEVTETSKSLAALAKQLNIPVITLAQLSRRLESRQDKRPMLSDLRESGGLEENAYAVLFLYRDAYYDKESVNQSLAECIIAKNRDGATGTADLYWRGEYTSFDNLASEKLNL